ncbi:hypothetical protein ACLKA7_017126 [Drosophila subpalustris]
MSGKDSYSYQHNYVDRVRLEDTNGNLYQQRHHSHSHSHSHQKTRSTHDPRCPQQLRAAGWRHTHKSVSHLDLATSCHDAAGAGIDHSYSHSQSHNHRHRQLQLQLHHHQQHSHHHPQHPQHPQAPLTPHAQPHWTQCRVGIAAAGVAPGTGHGQLRNARSLDYTQLERDENALDIAEFYWHFDAEAPLEQLDEYAVNDNSFEPAAATPQPPSPTDAAATVATTTTTTTTAAATTTAVAAIEKTPAKAAESTEKAAAKAATSGATVTATYLDFGSESCSLRRSRSLAVIREETFSDLQIGSANSSRRRSQLIPRARLVNRGFFRESPRLHLKEQQSEEQTDDAQSNTSGATTCDSHQQQQLLKQQQQQQQQQEEQQQQQHRQRQQQHRDSRDFDVYYDNLKRLDALALGLGLSEQLHPWHNDKSDLESLNSDYFKNSLHQNPHSHPHHHVEQLQPSSLEFEALEQAVTLLSERPRIYQSRRQQQQQQHQQRFQQQRHIDLGAESCPEHSQSQSSVFPETTTSNSDDQTDSPSLSEQEYDLTHIEEIFQGQTGEESYELISLTTTTRTRFESSEEEEQGEQEEKQVEQREQSLLTTPTETETSDTDGTLKRQQLDKLIAYDSVYLSSEDSSECTLIGESCESFEQRTSLLESESRSLLHISIEDSIYEPQPRPEETQIFTQILKIEGGIKPRNLSVVEKRKQKQEQQQGAGATASTPELKRQATDSFVSQANKSNLVENQYHSLPDVNIGVSLKVCENIDKELRTSYNLQRQQQRKEQRQQQTAGDPQVVTRAETYDSIRRFGRAHQRARQKEYEERERQREQEAETCKEEVAKEKREKQRESWPASESEKEADKEEEEEEPLPPPPPPLTEAEAEDEIKEHNDNLCVSISQAEQPKEATVVEVANFSKLIERRAQEIRQRKQGEEEEENCRKEERLKKEQQQQQEEKNLREKNQLKLKPREEQQQQQQQQQPSQSFRIIVTDAQNNIIQTEAIQEQETTSSTPATNTDVNCITAATNSPQSHSHSHSHSQRSLRRSSSSSSGKPSERRVLSSGAPIYKARPIKVLASDSFAARQRMSRPQILHVVDSNDTLRRRSSTKSMASTVCNGAGEVAQEYLQKVDAVKCYWNKLAGNAPSRNEETADTQQETSSRLHFQLGDKVSEKSVQVSNDFSSIMPPSIEIVELGGDGSKKATIVSAAQNDNDKDDDDDDEDAAQFDHIRYKVLGSQQLIRSNILTARNKKEAQFDGLIQYLQDYSFQELLSNNNVVIVEPVRTKIERPLTVGVGGATSTVKPVKPQQQQANAKTTTTTKKPRQRQLGGAGVGGGGAAAKRHFFYQPVRVNRELYEDELPDPDTVRNVRRFFEQHVLPTPGQGILVQSQQKFGGSACQLSPKTRRARGYRYLTIDTSYGGASTATAEEQPKGMELLEEHRDRKHWDNASLSSGISSGDLSSPCGECHNQQESPVMACKGVHVLDVVRRHNSNAANAKARAKLASRRTWCVGGGGAGGGGGATTGDARLRQIYEQANLEIREQEQGINNHHHDQDNDDDDDDDDVETDMCESYYVSNDILAKIRECGSTVTYYGGRVLEPGLPLPGQSNQQLMNGNGNGNANGNGSGNENNAESRTRSRVRQIEACNECYEHEQQQHQQQQQLQLLEAQQDSYQGIKFKLVKSNSCSSRLELAGAEEEEGRGGDNNTTSQDMNHIMGDSEVVRKMVHHFECNQPTNATTGDGQLNVTINSQSNVNVVKAKILEATAPRQVTVNNHINVMPQQQLENEQQQELETTTTTTYHSQAMNIRLESSAGRGSDKPNNNSKICRNRNVDLAYTLAKPKAVNAKYNDGQDDVKTCQPAQIMMPIEIHESQPQERRLSNASSSASTIVDKTVVRHYVANDKSIYERRKYDEIEFEEFEIYDPAKEKEKLEQQQQQQTEESDNSLDRRQTIDEKLYDSLDDRM